MTQHKQFENRHDPTNENNNTWWPAMTSLRTAWPVLIVQGSPSSPGYGDDDTDSDDDDDGSDDPVRPHWPCVGLSSLEACMYVRGRYVNFSEGRSG